MRSGCEAACVNPLTLAAQERRNNTCLPLVTLAAYPLLDLVYPRPPLLTIPNRESSHTVGPGIASGARHTIKGEAGLHHATSPSLLQLHDFWYCRVLEESSREDIPRAW